VGSDRPELAERWALARLHCSCCRLWNGLARSQWVQLRRGRRHARPGSEAQLNALLTDSRASAFLIWGLPLCGPWGVRHSTIGGERPNDSPSNHSLSPTARILDCMNIPLLAPSSGVEQTCRQAVSRACRGIFRVSNHRQEETGTYQTTPGVINRVAADRSIVREMSSFQ
jgi:hypothetical protein